MNGPADWVGGGIDPKFQRRTRPSSVQKERDSSLLAIAQNDRGLRQKDVEVRVILRERSDRRICGGRRKCKMRDWGVEELNITWTIFTTSSLDPTPKWKRSEGNTW